MGLAAPVFLGSDETHDPSDGEARGRRHLSAVGDETRAARWESGVVSVVVVEDDPAMQLLVRVNLEAQGFQVVLAVTGAEGLAAVKAHSPDLVLLDVMLPDLGGFEVAEQLAGMPVVFMSARASATDFARGRALGALDYVTKPFDPVTLAKRLREDLIELDRGGSAAHVWAMRFGPNS